MSADLLAERLMETDDLKMVKNRDCAKTFRKMGEPFEDKHEVCATGVFKQTYRQVMYQTRKKPKYTILRTKQASKRGLGK